MLVLSLLKSKELKLFNLVSQIISSVLYPKVTPPIVQFGLKHTLRFPRMVNFRPDKGWKDIMTLSEFDRVKLEGRRGQKRGAQEEA